jgi:hypothetical protein
LSYKRCKVKFSTIAESAPKYELSGRCFAAFGDRAWIRSDAYTQCGIYNDAPAKRNLDNVITNRQLGADLEDTLGDNSRDMSTIEDENDREAGWSKRC